MSQKSVPRNGYKNVPWLFRKEIEIPEEWKVRKTDDVFEFLISGTNARSDLNDSSKIRYIHYGDIHTKWNLQLDCDLEKIPRIDKEKVSRLPLLKDGDLIIADASEDVEGSGTSILLKNVKNKKIVAGLHTLVLRSKDENISFEFMKYLTSISHVKIQITSYVTGAKVSGLTKKSCKGIKVPFPELPEQQQIASILSNVDNLIQNTDKLIEKTTRLKNGLMQKLLTKGIGHAKSYKPLMLNSHSIIKADDYSVDWNFFALGDPESGFFSNGVNKNKEDYGHGCLFVNISDVFREFTIDSEKLKRVEVSKDEIKKYGLQKDDIILDRSSNIFETVGYPAYFAGSNKPVVFSGFTFRYRPNPKIWNSKFLTYQLMSYPIRKLVISISTKSANSNVNQNSYKKILIPSPNLPEQQKIVSILSNTDEKIQSYEQYKEKLQRLKKSLMQKLLTGQVRVAV